MSDEKLIDVAKAFLGGDQDVVAAGLSQPLGTTGGMAGATDAGFATDSLAGEVAGVAARLGAGRAMAHVDGCRDGRCSRSPSTPNALACGPARGRLAARVGLRDLRRVGDPGHRARARERAQLTIEDPATGRTYEWEGRIGPRTPRP